MEPRKKWVRHFGVAPVLRGAPLIPAVIGVHERESIGSGKHVESKSRVEQYACRPGNCRVMRVGVRISAVLTAILAVAHAAGCTRIHTEKGLEPTWLDVGAGTFQVGVSTQSDVMAALGPPSQIITGKDGEVFYYLHEEAVGTGVIFIVYNQVQLTTRYDRAIFFFDPAGLLQDYAVSKPPSHVK